MSAKTLTKSVYLRLAIGNRLAHQYADSVGGSHVDLRQFIMGRPLAEGEAARFSALVIPDDDLDRIRFVEEIRDPIIVQFLPLVKSVAKTVSSELSIRDDLILQGQLDLIRVVYDYTLPKFKFITYATHSLYRMLRRYALSQFQSDGLSSNSSAFANLQRAYAKASVKLVAEGKRPTYHNVVEHLGLNEKTANYLLGVMAHVSHDNDDRLRSLREQADEGLRRVDEMDAVMKALESPEISKLEREALLAALDGLTVETIAEKLEVPRAKVVRNIKTAKNKLHSLLAA